MKKRALAIILIVVLATAGLFAAMPSTGNGNNAVSASLNATIGDFLYHGFVNGTGPTATKYNASVTVNDAFNETTPPSFTYGFKTNAVGSFTFTMAVGNFIHSDGIASGVVKIKAVKKDNTIMTPISNVYNAFVSSSATGGLRVGEALFTILPATSADIGQADHSGGPTTIAALDTTTGAPAGAYEATITFTVSAS